MSFRTDRFGGAEVVPFTRRTPGATASEAKLPVLIILHQESSTPGRVGNALRALGHALDIRRPRFGDALPETLDRHAGAVVFGGPMSANDPDDYVRREIDWIDIPLREQRPFLGICLGAQMLAMQLGARVAPHPQALTQIGYYPIRPTAAGHALCPAWPAQVYHWHREGFELPAGTRAATTVSARRARGSGIIISRTAPYTTPLNAPGSPISSTAGWRAGRCWPRPPSDRGFTQALA
jgi:GMP synthase (glutamine-hydrolysing)